MSRSYAQRFPVPPWCYRLAGVAKQCTGNFNAQDLANTAWAFAAMNRPDEKPFTALARAAELRVSEFNAQDLANTAWAFAAAGQSDVMLFGALAMAAERLIGDFNTQD